MIEKHVLLTVLFTVVALFWKCEGQDVNVALNQGNIVGLKVFPEASRTPVLVYLGIPYARPPVGDLRFAPPVPHSGWNRTLIARAFKPLCPQLDSNVYDEVEFGFNYNNKMISEDCLYLNIWAPETAFRYGGFPVVMIITGEEMSFDWLINRPAGLDLASEGVIVVTVQYRSNIFGWFTLEYEDAPGNLGLHDQNMALVWIKENIKRFGGDPNKITILGHGSTGASSAMIHITSPKSKNLINSAVIMSGTVYSKYLDFSLTERQTPSERLLRILACDAPEKRFVLKCMREKSISDLLRAFDNIYQNGNYSQMLGPVVDNYLKSNEAFIRADPRKLFFVNNLDEIPILMGITSNEGAFIHEQWIDLARQGYRNLKKFIDRSVLPQILENYKHTGIGQQQVIEAINWKYFDQIPKSPAHLLNSLQKLISETRFEVPFYETIEVLSKSWIKNSSAVESTTAYTSLTSPPEARVQFKEKTNLFVYVFQQSNSMDMRGKINFFGGASHSSDLPFLLGPSLFQQIGRKKMNLAEEKLCKRMRQFFADFIKTGNPTPGRLFDAWHPFTFNQKYIKLLDSKPDTMFKSSTSNPIDTSDMDLLKIQELLNPNQDDIQFVTSDISSAYNPYSLNNEKDQDQAGARQSKATTFLEVAKDSDYYYYLKKVYAFWDSFLPKLVRMLEKDKGEIKTENGIGQELLSENSSPKYKHAFFSMLTLVCFLLAMLCVCLYILKKNDSDSGSTFL